ncbi:MAG: hypothetical protein GWN97_22475, partial [Thermoplasmata archaeon]|nr:hypothetical protein [Thermoplasmata archaeon]NIT80338.1 hypothetical protein [Thermoplasmata archaeon]NIY06706.1 hypothetical protein [Thermoplasmata archaeon]
MALNLLPLFMAAIRRRESGSYLGNYSARNGRTGAYGAYQIMPGNWAPWAAQAGIPGADRRSKAAQDYVAEYKMRQYYARYGDWGLVAIAWYAGPSRADRAAREGINSVSGIMDRHTGGTVGAYVAGIMEYMQDPEAQKVAGVSIQEEAAPGMDDPFASFYTSAPFMGALNSAFTGSFEINQDSGNATRDALTVLLDELSHASAGGQRQYPGANFPSQAMGTLQGGFHEGWVFPVAGPNEWSRGSYGYRRTPSQVKAGKSPVHQGIDIFAERGTPVIAPVGGVVVSKGNGKIAGHYVKI